jgi:hypothetical protein
LAFDRSFADECKIADALSELGEGLLSNPLQIFFLGQRLAVLTSSSISQTHVLQPNARNPALLQ